MQRKGLDSADHVFLLLFALIDFESTAAPFLTAAATFRLSLDAQPAGEVHPAGEDDDLHREAFPR